MLTLPDPLRTQLLDCMKNVFTYQSLQVFSTVNKEIFGYSYDTVIPAATPFHTGMTDYIAKLEKFNTVFYFVKLFYDQYKANAMVDDMYKEFLKVYEDTSNGPFRIRGEFLDCILIDSNSLPFIGRSNVKEAVYKMLNGDRPRVTLLRGDSRSGLSYTQRYLNEIAGKTKEYQLVTINLINVQEEFAGKGKMLYASHIAAHIAGDLAMETKVDADSKELFKITPFIGQLKKFVQTGQKTYLFFFDQFEGPAMAADVPNLILGIADLAVGNAIRCFTFLSGARDNELQNWPAYLLKIIRQPANNIRIDYFDKQQLELFFKKIYLYLSVVHNVPGSLEDFIWNINTSVITDACYTLPNVEKIGEKVTLWYEGFCQDNS